MKRIGTDRSRIERYQRCHRARWHEYHNQGVGLRPKRESIFLSRGKAIHAGLATLLRTGYSFYTNPAWSNRPWEWLPALEEEAVLAALREFAPVKASGIELELAESMDMQRSQSNVVAMDYDAQIVAQAKDLGMSAEEVATLLKPARDSYAEFQAYLFAEQSCLVENVVRAYARRRLLQLFEQYEVLEVEREGSWLLEEVHPVFESDDDPVPFELWFMSRPDALLRERSTGNLFLQSFKHTASWDDRKEKAAKVDMQGLSEGIEVERRLGERILGIRYEFLHVGKRWKDKNLSFKLGMNVWTQRSPLVQQYVAVSVPQTKKGPPPFKHGDVCWSWEYLRDDGSEGKLAWQNWEAQAVWDAAGRKTPKDWMDALCDAAEVMSAQDSTVGLEPRSLGWQSRAQALGFTTQHPLDTVFLPVITVYRNDDDLRDMLEQIEAQEVRVAGDVARVEAAQDEGEQRSLLNQLFSQHRDACEYPGTCAHYALCYGGEEIRRNPMSLYELRQPNHPQEISLDKLSAKE